MSRLVNWLIRACNDLGLPAECDFEVVLADGVSLQSIVRIAYLGGQRGMLIFRSYEEIQPYAAELIRAGYGYSVLGDPREKEEFDLDSYVEMFSDWGWTGDRTSMPSWIK